MAYIVINGEPIRIFRESLGIGQIGFAKYLGIPQSRLSVIESANKVKIRETTYWRIKERLDRLESIYNLQGREAARKEIIDFVTQRELALKSSFNSTISFNTTDGLTDSQSSKDPFQFEACVESYVQDSVSIEAVYFTEMLQKVCSELTPEFRRLLITTLSLAVKGFYKVVKEAQKDGYILNQAFNIPVD